MSEEANGSGSANKKPIYKKVWFWVVIGILVLIGCAGGNSGSPRETEKDAVAIEDNADDTANEDDSRINGVSFSISNVRNDVTGKWRIALIAEPIVMDEYAFEYYKKFFKSDDEIHAIVNFTYKTTTRISKTPVGLNVTTHEYVEGEEHDAKTLFSGMVLSDKYYDSKTGEEIKLEGDASDNPGTADTGNSQSTNTPSEPSPAAQPAQSQQRQDTAPASSATYSNSASASDNTRLPLKAICKDGTVSYQDNPALENYRGMCSSHGGISERLGRVE